jgi:hypothetical protein
MLVSHGAVASASMLEGVDSRCYRVRFPAELDPAGTPAREPKTSGIYGRRLRAFGNDVGQKKKQCGQKSELDYRGQRGRVGGEEHDV